MTNRTRIVTPVDYNQISTVYDDVRKADVDLFNAFLREVELDNPAQVALDVGCGTGNHTDLIQRLGLAQVCGVEPSAGMLDKARRKNGEITFRQGSAAAIPFEAGYFDFVFMTDVIHHVPDIGAMFVELNRVLKPGGKVCIVTQSHRQIEGRAIARFFPQTATVDQARYPDIAEIIEAASPHHFTSLKNEVLYEGREIEIGPDYLELVRKKGYSMLHLISDEAYAAGLAALEVALRDGPVKTRTAGETLVWLQKA